jgi:hypothetical protein
LDNLAITLLQGLGNSHEINGDNWLFEHFSFRSNKWRKYRQILKCQIGQLFGIFSKIHPLGLRLSLHCIRCPFLWDKHWYKGQKENVWICESLSEKWISTLYALRIWQPIIFLAKIIVFCQEATIGQGLLEFI